MAIKKGLRKIKKEIKKNAARYKKCEKCGLLHEKGIYYKWTIEIIENGATKNHFHGTHYCPVEVAEKLIEWLKENKEGL